MHLQRTLRSILRLILVLVGCLHLFGGHFGVLQLVAWSRMIVDYSSENGLIQGTIETFDGEHPCELCQSISEAKQKQRKLPTRHSGRAELELKHLLIPEPNSIHPPLANAPPPLNLPETASLRTLWQSLPAVPPPRPFCG